MYSFNNYTSSNMHFIYIDADSMELEKDITEYLIEICIKDYIKGDSIEGSISKLLEINSKFNSDVCDKFIELTGVLFHELKHVFDFQTTYCGYELFYAGMSQLITYDNILYCSNIINYAPEEVLELIKRDENNFKDEESKKIFELTKNAYYNSFYYRINTTSRMLNTYFIEYWNYSLNDILEFSATTFELFAIKELFGKNHYLNYYFKLMKKLRNTKHLELYNLFSYALDKRNITIEDNKYLLALEGLNLIINASLNGTTWSNKKLYDGPHYLVCFFLYFHEWLENKELNRNTALDTVNRCNKYIGALTLKQMYSYLSNYLKKHLKSESLYGTNPEIFKKFKESKLSQLLKETESLYLKNMTNYKLFWEMFKPQHLLRYQKVENITILYKTDNKLYINNPLQEDFNDIYLDTIVSSHVLLNDETIFKKTNMDYQNPFF